MENPKIFTSNQACLSAGLASPSLQCLWQRHVQYHYIKQFLDLTQASKLLISAVYIALKLLLV